MLGNEYTKIDVYESEASRSVRGQGGTLDLRASTGQRALRLAGLYAKFRSLARPEGQDLKILSKDGICRFQQSSSFSFSNKPEIDRGQLRDLLLESLNDGTVHWNHTLTSLHESDDGIRMNFANGETTVADLVVGADGAWSKVRKFLEPNIAPAYSGISFLDFHLDTCTEGFSNLSRLVGRGTMFALAPKGGCKRWPGSMTRGAFSAPSFRAGIRPSRGWRTLALPTSQPAASTPSPSASPGAPTRASRCWATPRTSCRHLRGRASTSRCTTPPFSPASSSALPMSGPPCAGTSSGRRSAPARRPQSRRQTLT